MLTAIVPKLPMRDRSATRAFYTQHLGFVVVGAYDHYLIVERDGQQVHFFLSERLDPQQNDGQIYLRTNDVDGLHAALIARGTPIHPNGELQNKPWGQREFAVLDPDNNLLTFGQPL